MSHNFLALVTALADESGESAPTTVTGQIGMAGRLVKWINRAWVDIQNSAEQWQFLRASFSFATVNQQATYTAAQAGITDFASWKRDSVRISTTSSALKDEMLSVYMDYDTWRNLYQYGNMRTTYTRPTVVTVTPDKQLGLGAIPDATGYTVNGEYYRTAQELTADTDTPLLPDRFYMVIVWRALMMYGAYMGAIDAYSHGEKEYKKLMAQLRVDQLPTITFGPSLA